MKGTGSRFFGCAAIVMVLAMMLSPAVAGAQSAGSEQIITGQTLSWTADWAPEPDVSVSDQNLELFALSSGSTVVGYGGTAVAVPGDQLRDILLEGFATEGSLKEVDRGQYDNVSYSIDLTGSGDVALAIFTLVVENPTTTTISVLIDGPSKFAPAMASAQSGITVDGVAIFQGVDGAAMQQTITAAGGTVTQAQTPTVPSLPSPTPSGGLTIPSLNTTPVAPAQTPTPAAQAPANAVSLASSGVELRYGDAWSIQAQDDASVSLVTSAAPAALITVLDLGPVSGAMDAPTLATAVQGQVANLSDAEVVAALNPTPSRVVIVYRDPDSSGTLYRIYDIDVSAVSTTAVTLVVAESDVDAAVALVASSVQVSGKPVMTDLKQLVPQIFPAGV